LRRSGVRRRKLPLSNGSRDQIFVQALVAKSA
jgi:hypothetical protein